MSEFTVPAGNAPPFAVVTATDRTGWIIITLAYGLSWVLLFSVIRICIRLTIAPPFGLDDVFLGLATIFTIAQSSTTLYAASRGLGKSVELLSPEALTEVQKLFYSSTILLNFALGLSKCSIAALLLRMTPVRRQLLVFKGALVFLATWTVASILAVALQCNLSHPWVLVGEECPGMFLRWKIVESLDVITELGLFALVLYLVWNVRLQTMQKATVVIVFALRLPIIMIIAFRIATFDEAGYTTNPTLDETLFIIWSQAELGFSIVAATLPTLRRFISGLATYYGALNQKKANEGSTYEIRLEGETSKIPLASVTKSVDHEGRRFAQPDTQPNEKQPLRNSILGRASKNGGCSASDSNQDCQIGNRNNEQQPLGEWGNRGVTATHVVAQDSNSRGSNESQQMIIKSMSWAVEHESNWPI
ncbi:hypothetical protein EPUS_09332 [Endocarpon pusillum Z07020]|uniref:Rhodopsin domain-containing protein n=1 Tax=Endocarpon pusillum (strain Z07020 / HMAS-L-300199) TaxID=1263415 RepID=U1GGX7_ENDPU|nr:uncharacterized protein EPUS_09332 [Endocarpon pusillum Z07020]ERF71368.1 hypothetical protein EPUS_09332 [Endocarpon pusillum Z07020]